MVKVRINASGKRVIGSVVLPEGFERISDVLNDQSNWLEVLPVDAGISKKVQGSQVMVKEAITYVEAIEEPRQHTSALHCGRFVPVVVEMKEPAPQQLVAELFVPYDETLFDVLSDGRKFVCMRNVHFPNFVERYPFLAVNKKALILVKG